MFFVLFWYWDVYHFSCTWFINSANSVGLARARRPSLVRSLMSKVGVGHFHIVNINFPILQGPIISNESTLRKTTKLAEFLRMKFLKRVCIRFCFSLIP